MTDAAGITAEQMANLDWNPQDGGSYEKAIAHLTVDKNGKRGDEAGFDKNNVAVYGLGLEGSGSGQGQTQWSFLTATTGWTHTDKNPWGTKFNYDDPKFQETIAWWAGLADKGYMPKLETTVGASMADNFGAGKAAINTNGSWMIGQYTGYKGIETGIAPTPKGPDGKRASMFNGLADSIWAGTKNPAASVKWVEYLASAACQDVVASKAVVFPAITASSEKAAAGLQGQGHRRHRLHHARQGQDHVPVPHHGQRGQGRRHHEAGHGRRALRQEAGQLPDRGQRPGQRPLQVGRQVAAVAAAAAPRRLGARRPQPGPAAPHPDFRTTKGHHLWTPSTSVPPAPAW